MNVFLHTKAGALLNDKFRDKKWKNPSFSIRGWAAQLGLGSHGSLQQILAGKRTVPKKFIPRITKSLDFTTAESLYLETLVDFEKAKTQDEKDLYYSRLSHLRPDKNEVHVVEIENYKYFQNPLHSIVRTMIEREDFVNDPEWIKENLKIKTSQREVQEVLDRLIALGLVEENDKELKKTCKHVKNKVDVPSSAVCEYHEKMSMVAAEQVKIQDIKTREYNSFCLNLKKEHFARAQKKIRDFVNEFISEFEASNKKSNETYQLNVQLFSLTNKREELQ
jgi:uncharacterized protein (TIGR02147 family)